jgi:YD repeat-containing protein
VDAGGNRVYEFCLGSATAVGDDPDVAPEGGALLTALRTWPNPAHSRACIRFALGRETDARLEVHDLAGRLVRRLVAERLPAGEHTLTWDGRDAAGRRVAGNLYWVRLSAGTEARASRLVMLR